MSPSKPKELQLMVITSGAWETQLGLRLAIEGPWQFAIVFDCYEGAALVAECRIDAILMDRTFASTEALPRKVASVRGRPPPSSLSSRERASCRLVVQHER